MSPPEIEEFLDPSRECDLVMKGGITSGVVYPRLVLELARDYRFVNIGGTSAGAIAAGLTAAAEYGRESGGFVRLAGVPKILEEHLLDLFQPHPEHRRTFRRLLKLLRRDEPPSFSVPSLVRHFPLIRGLVRSYRKLPETDYGLCPGTTQRRSRFRRTFPGLTDWLNLQLEQLAGRIESDGDRLPEKPLTFGDLAERGIVLRTVTTDLSSKNPVLLPFEDRTWMVHDDDVARLFPDNVARWLRSAGQAVEDRPGFRKLPEAADLPVLLGVRASLSFPVLFATLPFYRRDRSLRLDRDAMEKPRVCRLSDGGISSNFPIHLFDDPLPRRPTFAVSLDAFDRRRHHEDPSVPEGRVYLPDQAGEGIQRPIDEIGSPLSFVAAIFNAARNWQDQLQSVLPGYRERIVHIALTPDEGGLNLDMEAGLIETLVGYGSLAGRHLSEDFDFGEHRWRRLLTAYGAFEKALGAVAESWDDGFGDRVAGHAPGSYDPRTSGQKEELLRRMEELAALGRSWEADPLREAWGSSGLPRPRTHLKQVPQEQAAGVAEDLA